MSTVRVYRLEAQNRIVVAPTGHWTAATVHGAVREFLELLGDGEAHFVGDCRMMTGYDGPVRDAWQGAFRARRKQILSFTFVGVRSAFIRMGIAAMALFMDVPMVVVDELEGLPAPSVPTLTA